MSGTVGAGVATTAKSTFSGTVADGRVCLEPADFGMARIDGIHLPLERGVLEIFENSSANRAGSFGGPDQGHGIRQKQCIEAGLRAVLCVSVHVVEAQFSLVFIVDSDLSIRVCLADGDQRIEIHTNPATT